MRSHDPRAHQQRRAGARRGRGDLLVQVIVDTPTDLTEEEAGLLNRLAELRGHDIAPPEGGFMSKLRSAFK